MKYFKRLTIAAMALGLAACTSDANVEVADEDGETNTSGGILSHLMQVILHHLTRRGKMICRRISGEMYYMKDYLI